MALLTPLDPSIEAALHITPASGGRERTVDITTIGAKSGEPRRIEIWFYRVDGEIYLTGRPAPRAWYANIVAHPYFTFHVKNGAQADLPARGVPVLDEDERRRVFTAVIAELGQMSAGSGRLDRPLDELSAWLHGSPLVRVEFVN